MSHKLEWLIGKSGLVDGRTVEIIEILYATQEIILRELDQQNALLKDQYGEVTSRTHRTFTIPILSMVSDGCHPVLLELLNNEEQKRLLGKAD